MNVIEKVTSFITRRTPAGTDLLLFQHPYAGIQIPAGTVESGEPLATAALREAQEETGLAELQFHCCLGVQERDLPAGQAILYRPATVYARPDPGSFDWAYIRRGIQVEVLRQEGEWAHIRYAEDDSLLDPHYLTLVIQGWAKIDTLATSVRRAFYHFTYAGAGPERWEVQSDNHRFRPFWAPLSRLPEIVAPQAEWLSYLGEEFP